MKLLSRSILDLGKCTFTFIHFWLRHFPRSNMEPESSFLIKYYIITSLHFFWSVWSNILKSIKNGFPLSTILKLSYSPEIFRTFLFLCQKLLVHFVEQSANVWIYYLITNVPPLVMVCDYWWMMHFEKFLINLIKALENLTQRLWLERSSKM